jgi:hypothetical protein
MRASSSSSARRCRSTAPAIDASSERGSGAEAPELWIGRLRAGEHVTHGDGHDAASRMTTCDPRRAGTQLERRERRTLAALGEDPDRTARSIEEAHGMTNGASAVTRVVEVDAERADEPEEREAHEVSGVHHRVGLDAEEIGDEQGDERVPVGRVIRDDEKRRFDRARDGALAPGDEHASERRADASARVAREPAREERGSARGDHGRTP